MTITLKKGDYCSTANMTESEYHAVAAAFMAAGAHDGGYRGQHWCCPSFGWWENSDGLLFGEAGDFKRHLTPAQIIGAVNAKSATRTVEQCRCVMTPVIKEKPMHPIDNLNTKRQARDVAEQQYQAALAEVREAYPWIRVEEKSESLPLVEWKAGDILQCSKEEWFSCEKFTVGCDYEMRTNSRNVGGRMFADFIDDEGDSMGAPLDHFTFIRRP